MYRFLAQAAGSRFAGMTAAARSYTSTLLNRPASTVVSAPQRAMGGAAHGHGHHSAPMTTEQINGLKMIRTTGQRFSGDSTNVAMSFLVGASLFAFVLHQMNETAEENRRRKTYAVELAVEKLVKLEKAEAQRQEHAAALKAAAAAAAAAAKAEEEAARLAADLAAKQAAADAVKSSLPAKVADNYLQSAVAASSHTSITNVVAGSTDADAADKPAAAELVAEPAAEPAAAAAVIPDAAEAATSTVSAGDAASSASVPAPKITAIASALEPREQEQDDDDIEGVTAASILAAEAAAEAAEDAADAAAVAADFAAASHSTKDVGGVFVAPSSTSEMSIFAGNGNPMLARDVCSALGVQLGRANVSTFADGEINVRFIDNVRGRDCYVIQSLCGPNTQDQIMELLLMISSLRRSSAERIVAVVPYFAYARQLDPNTYGRTHIPAADIAHLMEAAGVDHVVTVDLHRPQLIGFFEDTPVENLDTQSSVLPYLLNHKKFAKRPVTVVAPVGGTVRRALKFRNALTRAGVEATLAFSYLTSNQGKVMASSEKQHHAQLDIVAENVEIVGDIVGRDIIIVDDMVDSASRICAVSKALKQGGAKSVYAYATHGLFTGDAIERIEASPLKEVVVFDTVPVPMSKQSTCVRQLSSSALIAETIRRLHHNQSTTGLAHAYAEYSD